MTAVSCPLMALEHDVSRFHMAILDFAMPVLNGFQLVKPFRDSPLVRYKSPVASVRGYSVCPVFS